MNKPDWPEIDFDTGWNYVSRHTEEAQTHTVLDTGRGVLVVLPAGLPVFGIGWMGFIMLAPILLFMVIVLLIPILGFLTSWSLTVTTVAETLCCLLFFWAFTRVLKLMVQNHDLFPRRYFVTLGDEGIAMHFSRAHYPLDDPRAAISWQAIHSLRKNEKSFSPGWWTGNPKTTALEVTSQDGTRVAIPFRFPKKHIPASLEKIETLIRRKAGT